MENVTAYNEEGRAVGTGFVNCGQRAALARKFGVAESGVAFGPTLGPNSPVVGDSDDARIQRALICLRTIVNEHQVDGPCVHASDFVGDCLEIFRTKGREFYLAIRPKGMGSFLLNGDIDQVEWAARDWARRMQHAFNEDIVFYHWDGYVMHQVAL